MDCGNNETMTAGCTDDFPLSVFVFPAYFPEDYSRLGRIPQRLPPLEIVGGIFTGRVPFLSRNQQCQSTQWVGGCILADPGFVECLVQGRRVA